MGLSAKKIKSNRREQQRISGQKKFKREKPNQDILDSIGDPNAWTPEVEDAWIAELSKLSAGEIYRRFPPFKKPTSVRKRDKGSGWGDMSW